MLTRPRGCSDCHAARRSALQCLASCTLCSLSARRRRCRRRRCCRCARITRPTPHRSARRRATSGSGYSTARSRPSSSKRCGGGRVNAWISASRAEPSGAWQSSVRPWPSRLVVWSVCWLIVVGRSVGWQAGRHVRTHARARADRQVGSITIPTAVRPRPLSSRLRLSADALFRRAGAASCARPPP